MRSPTFIAEILESPTETDYESVVMEACSVLADTDCKFEVSGFGQKSWPVDVGYDLSAFVEQLPDAVRQLKLGLPAEIDLYGQGVERTLNFSGTGDSVSVRCVSRTLWQPAPEVELVDEDELINMFRSVALQFAGELDRIWPVGPAVDSVRAKLIGI